MFNFADQRTEMETLKVAEYVNIKRFMNIEIRENLRWLHTFPPLREREYIHELDSYLDALITVCNAVIDCSKHWKKGNSLKARQAYEVAKECARQFLEMSDNLPSTPSSYDPYLSRVFKDFAFVRWVRPNMI